ncbi:MAG: Crp/Fnr family transcriptional regulator [Candidatus Saccharibacteria bacterium]
MDLSRVSFFKGLDPQDLKKVESKSSERIYPKGTTIFVEGQDTDGIYIVTSGLIKIVKLSRDGREKTLAILGEGEILGEMALFEQNSRSAAAETLDQTTVAVISKVDFEMLIDQIPHLGRKVISILGDRLREADQQIKDLLFLNARSRVICNLVQLAEKHAKLEKGRMKVPLKLTHAELANLIGVSRETATKVITDLQDSGLITIERKQIVVHDLEKLQLEVI